MGQRQSDGGASRQRGKGCGSGGGGGQGGEEQLPPPGPPILPRDTKNRFEFGHYKGPEMKTPPGKKGGNVSEYQR